jgi:hypothetical protein
VEESTKTPLFRLAFVSNRRLNFNQSFETLGTEMSWNMPIVVRLLTPGILASVVGGLFLSSQWDRILAPSLGQATLASSEMMQLLREEHDSVAEMVKVQLAVSGSGFDSKPTVVAERRQTIALR